MVRRRGQQSGPVPIALFRAGADSLMTAHADNRRYLTDLGCRRKVYGVEPTAETPAAAEPPRTQRGHPKGCPIICAEQPRCL